VATVAWPLGVLSTNMSHQQWDGWVSPDIDYVKVCLGLPVL